MPVRLTSPAPDAAGAASNLAHFRTLVACHPLYRFSHLPAAQVRHGVGRLQRCSGICIIDKLEGKRQKMYSDCIHLSPSPEISPILRVKTPPKFFPYTLNLTIISVNLRIDIVILSGSMRRIPALAAQILRQKAASE